MKRHLYLLLLSGWGMGELRSAERQLTDAPHGHVLTNVNVWSPDSAWIVYDTRNGDTFDGTRIEQVNARTRAVRVLYTARDGAHCGVVTHNPAGSAVAFILGPERPTPDWNYGISRRRGVMADPAAPEKAEALDAANYAPPFTPGALRGGSHVHVFNAEGRCVSFTYDDEVLSWLDAHNASGGHEPNQRNVGVTLLGRPVAVPATHPRNHDGNGFSFLATRTVASPKPGSDEIARAFEEGWVGTAGYVRPDGTRQRYALAFQGIVVAADGSRHSEVFIVDLPEDPISPGKAPLEGTQTTRPAPPRGTLQRRLTRTEGRLHPGVAAAPRHWLRSSPDGGQIAFLMKDEAGVVQLWTVPPWGGAPRQLTRNPTGIESAFTWSPDGRRIAHVMDGSVCTTEIVGGRTERLTVRALAPVAPSPLACVYSPDGRSIAFLKTATGPRGAFPQIFVVDAPR